MAANLSDVRFVRFFDQAVNPAEYSRGFGFLGAVVFVANALRIWLEKRIVLWLLTLEARAAQLDKEAQRSVVELGKARVEAPPNTPLQHLREFRYAQGPQPVMQSMNFRATLAEALERRGNREARYADRGRTILEDDGEN